MTSRDGKTRGRGALIWLVVTLTVVTVLFIAGWYVAAHLARTRSRAIIAQLNAAGKTVDCRAASVIGFPISFGVSCKAVGYKDEKGGFSLTSGAARAAMPLYNPFRMNVLLHGPASIEAPSSVPLALDWEKLNAYLSLGMNDVTGILVEGKSVEVKNAAAPAAQPVLFKLGATKVTIEPSGGDLDIFASVADVTFGAALPDLQALPPISETGNIRVFDGAGILQTGLQSLRNQQFEINGLNIDPGSDSSAAVSGNISFDSEGLADGRLRVTLRNLKALSAILVKAFPQEAQKIEPAFAMLGALGNDQTLPVEIRRGKITLGFFKIGRLPPVN
ncbi:MAG TPA: DUF2125 domain-containing protein [Rhizobiaceae bacterium]|nr:DUF2125 domain-containing protein [Rhizobiaceae bacterium]